MSEVSDNFSRALQLRDVGKLNEAVEFLEKASRNESAPAAVFAVLGSIKWEMGQMNDAVDSFRKAVELAPRSETVSLGLFHALLDLEKNDDAFSEMRRFLSLEKSNEYNKILSDINHFD